MCLELAMTLETHLPFSRLFHPCLEQARSEEGEQWVFPRVWTVLKARIFHRISHRLIFFRTLSDNICLVLERKILISKEGPKKIAQLFFHVFLWARIFSRRPWFRIPWNFSKDSSRLFWNGKMLPFLKRFWCHNSSSASPGIGAGKV